MSLPNHDELQRLFETDPEAFEAKRKQLIEDHINSLPEEKREAARKTQNALDAKLK
ncbi:DUF3135 domain-containing protein [Vibrio owensii]|uniref:DUF3135 domain-containing protein n=1 Tax=Vibrio harveyi group TaxID=717610 RepID=UPI003CC5E63C